MDDQPRRPVCTPANDVAQSAPHPILVCKASTQKAGSGASGFAPLKKLRAVIAAAGLGEDVGVSGTACLAGCVPDHGKPRVVGWRGSGKATWLFGDIDPARPIGDLVEFARLCAALEDGWMSGRDYPPRLCETTLARITAAMIVTREGAIQ